MARVREDRLGPTVNLNVVLDKAKYILYKGLAAENGVSVKFVTKRLIENAILTRIIPWPTGAPKSVPIYDAETGEDIEVVELRTKKTNATARKVPASPAE